MVTLRTYLNPTQALLDKTLLDSNEIFCALADQNANLYGGGPFAMPVRLLVAEEQAEEADRILKNSDRLWPEEQAATFPAEPAREEKPEGGADNNPWEILAIASLFFFPGMHGGGWLAIVVGLSLTVLYFSTRRFLARDEKAKRP